MSDIERFIQLYKDFGIELTAKTVNDPNDPGSQLIIMRPSQGFGGNYNSTSWVYFDKDGKFISQHLLSE